MLPPTWQIALLSPSRRKHPDSQDTCTYQFTTVGVRQVKLYVCTTAHKCLSTMGVRRTYGNYTNVERTLAISNPDSVPKKDQNTTTNSCTVVSKKKRTITQTAHFGPVLGKISSSAAQIYRATRESACSDKLLSGFYRRWGTTIPL